ncbi:bifunctional dTDP-4-dehydrorhamnose 3,5-epimerase family protein/NAD(P)-dependent oxidoreductase [Nocardioides sp.]|uniref:bifunctional dTDP-4-dehydrorhamnose 3,5-epimerase family protein/NAD(P)-dependent oxidoreductase n=1 Tax=Nocardioides sp. TaxID=35761 RepID=UPI00260F4C52|nr:bifunctional dTDP-4-dehydrorhamnose 3,5-epimerase family protein/NAD(P)-dependent oxidoreductase [Nocardioides sp.]
MSLSVETTAIPGLLVVRLPLHEDARGWFKEAWQREKMVALGLPDFGPVQHNVSYNAVRGATRGIHAEPWDKFVSVSTGRAFGAWVDLRAGDSFGATVTVELDPSVAVFVPRGVGNSYQTLTDDVAYGYLVNDHWRAGQTYPALALDEPTAAIAWPIPLDEAEISAKDRAQPLLADVTPMTPRRPLVLGARGQLGRALLAAFPDALGVDLPGSGAEASLDVTDPAAVAAWPWREHDVILNAAAYTAVDAAETPDGRRTAWQVNAQAPATLAKVADEHGLTLVHFSSEYVFDGTAEVHTEDEPLSPLGVYAQTKAAGDLAAATARRHLVLRTSWLIGDGGNFVRTMARLADDGVSPAVVDDQTGRLTFATDLASATRHLLTTDAPSGTYQVSNAGPAMSWADVAEEVFARCGRERSDVRRVSTQEYAAGKQLAPRPAHSLLDLDKLAAAGVSMPDALDALDAYLA